MCTTKNLGVCSLRVRISSFRTWDELYPQLVSSWSPQIIRLRILFFGIGYSTACYLFACGLAWCPCSGLSFEGRTNWNIACIYTSLASTEIVGSDWATSTRENSWPASLAHDSRQKLMKDCKFELQVAVRRRHSMCWQSLRRQMQCLALL